MRVPPEASLVGAVFHSGESLNVPDLRLDPRAASGHLIRADIEAAMFVPLRSGATTYGVLYVANRSGGAKFGPNDQRQSSRALPRKLRWLSNSHGSAEKPSS